MDVKKIAAFRGWIPVRCHFENDRAMVDWCYLGEERLAEPFFDDSIRKRFRRPFNLLFQHHTPIEFLGELAENSEGLKPTGFIFHLSRCGSTLVSQMLAALPQNIVVSEASPLDFVLRKGAVDEETRIRWLRWMVSAMGQQRNEPERNFFIKFDSWNTLDINLVRRAFPDVPWIFLYRRPVEIIVSHMRQRGAHLVPGMIPEILPDLSTTDCLKMPPEAFCARVLANISRAALEFLRKGDGLAVDYTELPAAVGEVILGHFGVSVAPEDQCQMLAASKFDAKNPVLQFAGDSERKRSEASAAAVAAAEKFVDPVYEELEVIRKNA